MKANELAARAQACSDRYEVEEAAQLYRQALTLEPQNTNLLDALGETLLQLGQRNDAALAFEKSVELQPDGGSERYMYLGQLHEGLESFGWFARGVELLRANRTAAEGRSGSRAELRQAWLEATHALATGLCSAAEIFLTDLCDEPDAEQRCEALATEALQLVQPLSEQTLAEPYVTTASLRLSQQRGDEAVELLRVARDICAKAEEGKEPPLDLRLALAKMLMEVEMAAEALELLQDLRLEDDDSLEIWYLLGVAALQASEFELAAEQVELAIAFAQSPACTDVDAPGWLEQLQELQADLAHANAVE